MKYDLIFGIDPGMGGAIAVKNGTDLEVIKMPKTTKEIFRFMSLQMFSCAKPFCFLEKVNAFVGEDDSKKFGIIKMIEQTKSIKDCLEIIGIPYIEVASVTWQKRLKFKRVKGESKTQRKRKYYEWARAWAPRNKFLVPQGDAVCILACGLKMIEENDPLLGGDIHSEIEELF